MITELEQLQNSVFSKFNLIISHLQPDSECEEYFGNSFQLNQFSIKFRKAKITPKKIGQFVTLWKRNPESKQTEPFTSEDPFDFYIVLCEQGKKSGFFFFSKQILIQKNIITTLSQDGKRGFRVYPIWDSPENKQAIKTQNWQKDFFIDFDNKQFLKLFESILKS
ncbi:MepB family protein [Chryseobacterium luquanense]|uniref:MepB family protein n=1 Tax=Chryseobacterium luquanense TaxID=2983766 RepID=A0ABT3Y7S0_9FLAO|nr:MepB family protein [Chryseobacterium luquanense]MCX8534021.1 MepB family protein [Chryseobacterium luquanense]